MAVIRFVGGDDLFHENNRLRFLISFGTTSIDADYLSYIWSARIIDSTAQND